MHATASIIPDNRRAEKGENRRSQKNRAGSLSRTGADKKSEQQIALEHLGDKADHAADLFEILGAVGMVDVDMAIRAQDDGLIQLALELPQVGVGEEMRASPMMMACGLSRLHTPANTVVIIFSSRCMSASS